MRTARMISSFGKFPSPFQLSASCAVTVCPSGFPVLSRESPSEPVSDEEEPSVVSAFFPEDFPDVSLFFSSVFFWSSDFPVSFSFPLLPVFFWSLEVSFLSPDWPPEPVPLTFFRFALEPFPSEPLPGLPASDLCPPLPGRWITLLLLPSFPVPLPGFLMSGIRITSCWLTFPEPSFTTTTRSFSPLVSPVRVMVSVPAWTSVPFPEVSTAGIFLPASTTL